jgi:predicted TIM-barrel fold metal-dependent hydrolase
MAADEKLVQQFAGKRYVIISTDGHCGANLRDYKPYLESKWHEQFDAWADTYVDVWGEITNKVHDEHPDETRFHFGVVSYDVELNWDSSLRLEYMESQGVVAEVLFPNTVPPFAPSGVITAPAPRSQEEYELRWAGVKAHNRWLADFCNAVPGRRAGLAQLYIDDVENAVAEIRTAKQVGLKGVLLPTDHVLKMNGFYRHIYEPIWEVCAELNMPAHAHITFPNEGVEEGSGAYWVGLLESEFFSQRSLSHFVCSGVFERHPDFKFVVTEAMGGKWVVEQGEIMDTMWVNAQANGTYPTMLTTAVREAACALKRSPSEYLASNVFVGNPLDLPGAVGSGFPNIMFGTDLPHSEGPSPHVFEALRLLMSSLPETEVRTLTSLNAARCYDFDLDALQGLADEVGFTPEQIATPLTREAMPRYGEDTLSSVFRTNGDTVPRRR